MSNSSYYIPTLRNPDDCRDWLDRNKPLPAVHRGEVWFARLGKHKYTCVQEGIRPVLIVSNDANNRHASTVTVIPFTGCLKRTDLPTHVVFDRLTDSVGTGPAEGGLAERGKARVDSIGANHNKSMALVEQVTTLDKRRLINKIGRINDSNKMKEINRAVMIQFGIT